MQSELALLRAENLELKAENQLLKERLNQVLFQLAELQRLVFGTKSERFIPTEPVANTPTLFDLPEAVSVAAPDTKTITVTLPAKKKNEDHPGRKPLPAHLPREVTVLEPAEATDSLTVIGQDVTEVLDYTPGKLIVRQYIRPKYARPKGAGILTAELPELPLTRGMAGSGLLTQLIIGKFVDSLPIYRQIEIFKRQGVELAPATVSGWIEGAATLLEPLYENLRKQVLASNYIQADETRLQVLDRKFKRKTARGWLWAYHSPPKGLVLFDYAEGRSRENPAHNLNRFQGILQTDGYATYDAFEAVPGITLASCWAHARRELYEAKEDSGCLTKHAITEIKRLYDLERTIKELPVDKRLEQRQQIAVPILNALKEWMIISTKKVLPGSPTGTALAYSLRRWDKLMTYTTAGEIEIDSNLVENSIRSIAIGRKNFLFAGSHESAHRIAMLYSFMGSCKRQQVEPFTWLQKTLEIIPSWPANRLNELLPNYKPQKNDSN